jgi:hypothetical protein
MQKIKTTINQVLFSYLLPDWFFALFDLLFGFVRGQILVVAVICVYSWPNVLFLRRGGTAIRRLWLRLDG